MQSSLLITFKRKRAGRDDCKVQLATCRWKVSKRMSKGVQRRYRSMGVLRAEAMIPKSTIKRLILQAVRAATK